MSAYNTGTLALSFTVHHLLIQTLEHWLYPLLSTTSAYETHTSLVKNRIINENVHNS